MPNDERQLGNLLPFLTQLHQRRLSRIAVQQFGHPAEHPAILVTEASFRPVGRERGVGSDGVAAVAVTAVRVAASSRREIVVVLLLLGYG